MIVIGLEAETNYKIHVAAYTIKGDGPSSSTVNCKTLAKPPNKPFMYTQQNPGHPTEVTLSWDSTEPGIEAFKVRYAKSLVQLQRGRDQANLKLKVINLQAGTKQRLFQGLGENDISLVSFFSNMIYLFVYDTHTLCCAVLCCAVLCCAVLYYTILFYTILYYTILRYATLHYTTPHFTILYYTVLYYTILYYTILYYTILHYTIL